MISVPEIFGSYVFDMNTMQARLPHDTFKLLKKTIENGEPLDINVANTVANAMKDWAVEKGVTHYTHWFQPMTGITAEKHDSFINTSENGNVIMEFSGKELIKGEPDASSFPSGGIRATFEARGYTAWDPTSFAFIKDNTLCIPTAFCSYNGETLDKKTPLLRSMERINTESLRILKLFGNNDVTRVVTTVGAEQEYFLIDKEVYKKRKDLVYCGRTLFGSKSPKGQELDDHYFGTIRPRVSSFMKELDEELWKLGVLSKTKHNEVAPGQHELAPIFTTSNIATDHNQLTMEMMKRVAEKHNLVCLLHEKPFKGVNGSGKHNNWALSTNTGLNLLKPGKTPFDNAQFLLFLIAVIKAVDEHQDLLRMSTSGAGNDHRLGANEAPPTIISIFLGEELTDIFNAIENNESYTSKERTYMNIGVDTLPTIKKDVTDRNRTSPFAFTGNKFEFRMLGSSQSISSANIVLNTIVAESLSEFADILEKSEDFQVDLHNLIKTTWSKHKRIVFNGNNYSQEWLKEAENRGLLNLRTTADAIPYYIEPRNIELFSKNRVLNEKEIRSRYEIQLETYCKKINIEAMTMNKIAKQKILPAVITYCKELGEEIQIKKSISAKIKAEKEIQLLEFLSDNIEKFICCIENLNYLIEESHKTYDYAKLSLFIRDTLLKAMEDLREIADLFEENVPTKYWPYPTYGDLLFSV